MLTAYLDESGMHDTDSLSVAGVVAAEAEWLRFTEAWKKTLAEAGLEFFHAKEQSCDKLRGPLLNALSEARAVGGS